MVAGNVQPGEKAQQLPADESWWETVIADEPDLQQDAEVRSAAPGDMDWERVREVFIQDKICTAVIYDCNKGGVLVQNEYFRGFVPLSHLLNKEGIDLRDLAQLKTTIGSSLRLKIIKMDVDQDKLVLSERAAQGEVGCRNELLKRLHKDDVVSGVVTNITKFGVFIDLGGLEGLIHISELSWGRVHTPTDVLHAGEQVQAVILDIDVNNLRIALSLKRLTQNPWDKVARDYRIGDVLQAQVTKTLLYGAFARIEEGIEGLVHISSIQFPADRQKIGEYLPVGTQVLVKILNIDSRRRRLGLGLVQAGH